MAGPSTGKAVAKRMADKLLVAGEREQDEEDLDKQYAAHAVKITTDVRSVQKEKLKEILSDNAGCQYLSNLGVDGDTDVEAFKKKVPIVQYEDMEENFNRLANGEVTNFYVMDPINVFILSSGTSKGKAKLMPTTLKRFDKYLFLQKLAASFFSKCFPGMNDGKSMVLAFVGQQIRTPSGIMAGQGSTNWYKSDFFKKRPFDPSNVMTSPDAVILCEDYHQVMYCHLLCGLYQAPEVSRISAIFASTILAALRVLQACWKEICQDIREGTLNPKITDPELRKAVLELVQANPTRAEAVERECEQESWEGIVPRLWPNVVLVVAVFTGSQRQYVPPLKRFAGELPLVSPGYASAESNVLGLNLSPLRSPEETAYVLWPECQYYELLPVHKGEDGELETTELADAVMGQEYEPVLTTTTGLYRYRLGDVVKVTGFYNATPEVQFVRRRGVLLSIHQDKTDEGDLQAAVSKAGELLLVNGGVVVVDFTSCTDVESHPGHYVIFFELTQGSKALDPLVLQECASTLDKSIDNDFYISNRKLGIIGPLELRIVSEGTFERLMLQAVARGSAPQQYKTPRCIQFAQGLDLLNSRVLRKFESLATI